jgi:hypothetical protein
MVVATTVLGNTMNKNEWRPDETAIDHDKAIRFRLSAKGRILIKAWFAGQVDINPMPDPEEMQAYLDDYDPTHLNQF